MDSQQTDASLTVRRSIVNFRVSRRELEQLKAQARDDGHSLSDYVRGLVLKMPSRMDKMQHQLDLLTDAVLRLQRDR